MNTPQLRIRSLRLRPVLVPLKRPLVTRVVTVEQAALLLIDLKTEEGIVGHSYIFGYSPAGCRHIASLLRQIEELVRGEAVAPAVLYKRLRKALTLFGQQGLTMMAISGFDVACWDALAKVAGLPLARLLGGTPGRIPAYNSNGLGLIDPAAVAEEALALRDEAGYRMVKLRMGREKLSDDLAALRAARDALGEEALLPVDFNQGLTVEEALRRGHALDAEGGVTWIEEPIAYDDYAGCARIAAEVATPVQIGENFYGPEDLERALEAGAADYAMPDLERIGGVTGWLRAAAIAETARIEMSSHLFPEVSCHLMAVTPTAHWLEVVDWASPVLQQPLEIDIGHAVIPERPGNGLAWNEEAARRYAFDL
ncbi:MAG: enolase C-terminal domain-like protein [Rhodovibrionaceae bacterium]